MKRITLVLATFALLAGFVVAQDGAPPMEKPGKEHEIFKQLVGEWEGDAEMFMDPTKPTKSKMTESCAMFGPFWFKVAIKGDMCGLPFQGEGTFGFNATTKKYVGTWIDNLGSWLWSYQGSVDATGKIITWEADGPSFEDPAKMTKYRDVVEIKDADNRIFSSSVLKGDKWVPMMKVTQKRKK